MANIQFKQLPLSSPSLFPEEISEKISVNHPVRLVSEVVDHLDISAIIKQYKGGGTTSYHPRMTIKSNPQRIDIRLKTKTVSAILKIL
jgi:transposase